MMWHASEVVCSSEDEVVEAIRSGRKFSVSSTLTELILEISIGDEGHIISINWRIRCKIVE